MALSGSRTGADNTKATAIARFRLPEFTRGRAAGLPLTRMGYSFSRTSPIGVKTGTIMPSAERR